MTMKYFNVALTAVAATLMFAPSGQAQETSQMTAAVIVPAPTTVDTAKVTVVAKKKASFLSTAPAIEMQNYRPEDKRGINVFEAPKDESVEYGGFKLQWGAAFTQQFQ